MTERSSKSSPLAIRRSGWERKIEGEWGNNEDESIGCIASTPCWEWLLGNEVYNSASAKIYHISMVKLARSFIVGGGSEMGEKEARGISLAYGQNDPRIISWDWILEYRI